MGDFKRKSKIFEVWAPGPNCITYILSIKKASLPIKKKKKKDLDETYYSTLAFKSYNLIFSCFFLFLFYFVASIEIMRLN